MSRRVVRFEVTSVSEKGGLLYASGRGVAGEVIRDVLYIQPHGAAFHPPIGSVAVAVDLNGRREQMVVMGGESSGLRPTGADLGEGNAVLYNAHGQAVSVLQNEIRIVGGSKVLIKAAEIELDAAVVKLGTGATKPVSMQGSTDTAGHAQVGGLSSKVLVAS